jgi:hypothetical protein
MPLITVSLPIEQDSSGNIVVSGTSSGGSVTVTISPAPTPPAASSIVVNPTNGNWSVTFPNMPTNTSYTINAGNSSMSYQGIPVMNSEGNVVVATFTREINSTVHKGRFHAIKVP